jgi:hypothetical protein
MNFAIDCILLTEETEEIYTFDIYGDDTIDNVKSKLSELVENKNVDEYYFFTRQKTVLNPYDIYKKMSFDNTRSISYESFASFCLNHELPLPIKKDAYELDDFLELPTDVYETTPIGIAHETPFIVNPFKNILNQLEDSGTSSKTLWMTLPHTVYVCFAKDVYKYSLKLGLEMTKVFNVYYPYLFKEGKLEPSLFVNKEKYSYEDYNRMIDFHHSIYKPEMIVTEGITSIYFVMYTLQPFSFPLDIFFKLFQSTRENPYIKLNGLKTNENIYRLYCNQRSESGYKLPYLKKKTILKYAHDINKNSISYLYFSKDIPIFLNINKKGHIYFKLDQIPFLSVEAIELLLEEAVLSFTSKLLEYFDPSQKIFTHFENFKQSNISILDMKYKCTYHKEGKMNVKKNMTCFSPVFNFMNEKEKIQLRYKRVSNYNNSQSMDAYLIEAFNKAIPIEEMIHVFSANFMKHNDKAAADYVQKFFSEIEIEEKQNNLRRVKLNPGFLVEIEKKENIVEVTVHSIDNIHYLPYLRVYVTNMILISQGIISDNGMCKDFKKIEVEVQDIAQVKPMVEETNINFMMDEELEQIDEPDETDNESPLDEPNRSFNETPLPIPKNISSNSLEAPNSPLEAPNSPLESPNSPLEAPSNGSPDEDSLGNLTPPNKSPDKGGSLSGTISISESKSYEVFIYDDNDPYSIQKRFKKEPLREGKIQDYYRVFQGSECTIVKKENETCKGYVIVLNGQELKELMQEASILFLDYFDKPGNSYAGVTYYHEPKRWTDHPPIQFVKKVYATVAYGWNHKQDDKDEMYIYDKDNELKARYNGKYYVRLDEDEELTKIQFTPVNPLLQRMQEREPDIFTQTNDKHNQYSRMCAWSDRKHPVILSKEEKERIDQIAPNSYESAIEYGTDPKNPYFYICPRYWDLKHNMPVTPDKVDKDKLISRDATDSEKQRDIQSKYILELAKAGDKPIYHTRPGFLGRKNAKGFYMPCCFISKPKKDKPDAIEKRTIAATQSHRDIVVEESYEKVKDYIQNGDKFPLPENRKGHLTPILEMFFNLNFSDCYSQIQKRKLKVNYPCLLRQGVNESQSFLSSVSFLYFKKSAPLDTFLKVLLEKITLDTVQTFHNGSIIHTFAKDYEKQDVSAYRDTKLYKTVDSNAMKKIVNGYENFRKYLNSKEYIDYTYLWDVITQVLFKEKVNMIIFKEGLEDATHNLTIVCPTTAHALYLFNDSHPSILIYQKGDQFEPLYIYKKMSDGKDKTITMFDLSENLPTVNDILKKIHENIGDSCKAKTIHKSYTFKENLYLHELLDELKKTEYKVEKQIMNIDGRIFGLMVNDRSMSFFVPCRPSALSHEYNYEELDDTIWRNYRNTVRELNTLYEKSNHRIPCKPKIRVLENQLVVGIITETNQFIPMKEPEENKIKDDLMIVEEKNHLVVDKEIKKGSMNPKEKVIQHLKLEQMFYNAYFNTIKVELNDISNFMVRKKIEKAFQIKDKEKLDELFEPILEEKFLFVDDYDVDLYDIQHVNLCKNSDEPYCGKLEHEGKLLIPKENLFNKSDNSVSYKRRFIDDLMMNVHVQRILFEEIHSTLYYTDRYQLSDQEIILLESDLNTYLDKEPTKTIPSVVSPTLEDVQPSKIIEFAEKMEAIEELEKIYFDKDELSDEEIDQDLYIPTEPIKVEPMPEPVEHVEPVPVPIVEPAPIGISLDEPIKTRPAPVRKRAPKTQKLKTPLPEPESIGISLDDELPIPKTRPAPVRKRTPKTPKTQKLKSIAKGTSLDDVTIKPEQKPDQLGQIKPPLEQIPEKVEPKLLSPIKESANVESLSMKIKQNEEVMNVEKAQEYVKEAKSLYQKSKSVATENLLIQAQEHLEEVQPSLQMKIKRIEPDIIPCIKTFYFKRDSKWKDYFPPKTIGFRIMKGETYETSVLDLTCNFIMALQILKSYDTKYSTLTIRDLKEMLIQSYKHLSESIDDIDKKFRKEKKRFNTWSDIQTESYPFTQLDLIVLMIEYKLPVVIFIQAKNKIKLLTYHTDDTFKYYIKMKKKDVFMFFIYQKDFRIERKDMNALYDAERDIVYLNDKESLKTYMKSY